MKAKRIKGLDPAAPLAEGAAEIVTVRLGELLSFLPDALAEDEVRSHHDMRIAAKRLRYVLEATGFCFGEPADAARKAARELQDLLGEMHDVDVMLPRLAEHRAALRDEDAAEVREAAGDGERSRSGAGGAGPAPDRLPRARGLRGLPDRPPLAPARALHRALRQARAARGLARAARRRPSASSRRPASVARRRSRRSGCGRSSSRPSASSARRPSAAGCAAEALAEAERRARAAERGPGPGVVPPAYCTRLPRNVREQQQSPRPGGDDLRGLDDLHRPDDRRHRRPRSAEGPGSQRDRRPVDRQRLSAVAGGAVRLRRPDRRHRRPQDDGDRRRDHLRHRLRASAARRRPDRSRSRG